MKRIQQKHRYGCGPACLSMISGIPYDDIIAEIGGDFSENRGITHCFMDDWLFNHGFSVSRIYKYYQRSDESHENLVRDPWPPKPWADIHLVQLQLVGGAHFVLWLNDGRVLDPNRDDSPTLSDKCYVEINQIAGIHPFGRLLVVKG